jgi:plastocyanin
VKPLWLAFCLVPCIAIAGGGVVEGTVTLKVNGKPSPPQNALVFIEGYEEPAPEKPAQMFQTGRTFSPTVLPVVVKQKVEFINSEPDPTLYHHVFTPTGWAKFSTRKFLSTDKPQAEPVKNFTKPGKVDVFCNIHKEMIATVYVVPNKSAVVLSQAKEATTPFRIENVRAGRWTVVAWHRSLNKTVKAQVDVKLDQPAHVDLVIEGDNAIEQLLLSHDDRNGLPYPTKKEPDGGTYYETNAGWER